MFLSSHANEQKLLNCFKFFAGKTYKTNLQLSSFIADFNLFVHSNIFHQWENSYADDLAFLEDFKFC